MFPIDEGRVYVHTKSGNRYVLVGTCIREADEVECVLYRRESGEGFLWCRPLSEFTDRFSPTEAKVLL